MGPILWFVSSHTGGKGSILPRASRAGEFLWQPHGARSEQWKFGQPAAVTARGLRTL